jgi:membrane protein
MNAGAGKYLLHRFPGTRVRSPRSASISSAHLILRFLRLFRWAIYRAFEHDAFSIAKASAYSCIITFFPALLVVGSVLATSEKFAIYIYEISNALGRILPAGSSTAIAYLRSDADRPIRFLISTSLLTTWTASGVVISWMQGFRNAYQLPQTWGLVKERLIACSLVILAGVPMMFATVLVVFGSQIEARILFRLEHAFHPFIFLIWTGVRWLIAILTSIAVITLIYHNAIPRTQRWHSVLPGAALATAMWFSLTVVFGWYLNRYADYSVIYGSLGMGIALLVWMYLLSLVVLVGAEFNAMMSPRAAPLRVGGITPRSDVAA